VPRYAAHNLYNDVKNNDPDEAQGCRIVQALAYLHGQGI
jgi:hypothetical protein